MGVRNRPLRVLTAAAAASGRQLPAPLPRIGRQLQSIGRAIGSVACGTAASCPRVDFFCLQQVSAFQLLTGLLGSTVDSSCLIPEQVVW